MAAWRCASMTAIDGGSNLGPIRKQRGAGADMHPFAARQKMCRNAHLLKPPLTEPAVGRAGGSRRW